MQPIDILLVEDNPCDVRLTREAFEEIGNSSALHRVADGVEAVKYLRREAPYEAATRPDLILLDLNMPRKNGHEVLEEIKNDLALKAIPVVVLTTSASEHDIRRSYELHANCYVTKPVDFFEFVEVTRKIEDFWGSVARRSSEPDA